MFKKLKLALLLSLIPASNIIYSSLTNKNSEILYSAVMIFCIITFSFIFEKTDFMSNKTYYSVIVFIFLSLFLGKIFKFYQLITFWDKILHFTSGFILFNIGYELFYKYKIKHSLLSWTAFLFASSLASFWEIYEFFVDATLKLNAQGGSLNDTMLDIILGTLSAFIMLIITKIKNRCL